MSGTGARRFFPALVVLTPALLALSCSDRQSEPAGPAGWPRDQLTGRYDVVSHNDEGLAVARGWIEIDPDQAGIKGSWHMDPVGHPQGIGPQVGDGLFFGYVDGKTLVIELNPDMRDNNVVLRGQVDSSGISGRWIWITFAGPSAEGTFRALGPSPR